jgi:hypothetical protein
MHLALLRKICGLTLGLALLISSSAFGQTTFTWNGTGGNNLWTNGGNWTPAGPPGGSDTANFQDAGNGVNSISLGNAAQGISTISFTATPAAYNLGVLSSGDQFNIAANGGVSEAATVINPQMINAAIVTLGASSITNLTTANTGTLTFAAPITLGGTLTYTGATGGFTEFNGIISGNQAINVPSGGTIGLNAANTYGGGTTIGTATSPTATIQIGVSSVGSPGSITSGAFGTGNISIVGPTSSSGTIPPTVIFAPVGADRTVANNISITGTMTGAGLAVAADPSGAHNLTLAGSFLSAAGTITNNLPAGFILNLGTSGTSSTLAFGGTSFQGTGSTFLYDQITGSASSNNYKGGTVYIENSANSNTGNLTISGSGTVGSGGTVAGTGTISAGGTVTLSSTTPSAQGGIISPGDPSSPGTLTAGGSMAWDPLGEYVFRYNGNDATVGGGVNDLMTITGNLNLGNISATNLFTLDLAPTTLTASSTPLTYVIATTAGNINGASGDITNRFNIIGSFSNATTPDVTVGVDPANSSLKALLLTFTPTSVPEPTGLTFIGVVAAAALRRRGRKLAK